MVFKIRFTGFPESPHDHIYTSGPIGDARSVLEGLEKKSFGTLEDAMHDFKDASHGSSPIEGELFVKSALRDILFYKFRREGIGARDMWVAWDYAGNILKHNELAEDIKIDTIPKTILDITNSENIISRVPIFYSGAVPGVREMSPAMGYIYNADSTPPVLTE